jgi:Putative phage serine protease XkdF
MSNEQNEGLSDEQVRGNVSDNMSIQVDTSSTVDVIKTDDERMVVWGWASVATMDGEPVYDSHGDHIPMEELDRAATDFMIEYRVGKMEHEGPKVSEIFCLLPLSKSLAEALGLSSQREGLIVGYKVYDQKVWDMIKSGELGAISIGGKGMRYDE